ncbi:hypothetical protein BDV26DRAFT_256167 [Aspergillus bertholletiae]|uniref:Uncharacterized protein n=1 Tax=Aspergillus bertholletiae TaxID=1226010 RepID=A0A5N7BGN2_9EURO|nr:hypothetical protein BDV26DRAFT_256167 [Aspergillus bertholletiae]
MRSLHLQSERVSVYLSGWVLCPSQGRSNLCWSHGQWSGLIAVRLKHRDRSQTGVAEAQTICGGMLTLGDRIGGRSNTITWSGIFLAQTVKDKSLSCPEAHIISPRLTFKYTRTHEFIDKSKNIEVNSRTTAFCSEDPRIFRWLGPWRNAGASTNGRGPPRSG